MPLRLSSITGLCLLLLIPWAQRTHAQAPRERQQLIRAAVESGNRQSAISELQGFLAADANTFKANDYDYLLARLSEQSGDTTSASSGYQSVVARNSLLADYALWHLARMARATGDLILERERLRRLVTTSPRSILNDAAMLRLAESFFESRDFTAAATTLSPLALSKNSSLAREATLLMGQSYLSAGRTNDAREVFTRLLMQMPDASRPDDFALSAVRALDQLDGPGKPASTLLEADHLLRASVYQFNRDFAGARVHYLAAVENFPQSGTLPNALYQVGRGLYLEGKYVEALSYFQKTFDQFGQSASARDALSYIAGSYSRLKRIDDAIATYKTFINRFPDGPNPERSYLNLIDALHEAGRYPEALNWVQQTRVRFKGQLGSALALFAQMRIHLAQNSWNETVVDADELLKLPDLGEARVAGGTSRREVMFLRAYALEQMGRTEEAITTYLSIPEGRNEYYGTRATQRLLALGAKEKAQDVQAHLNSLMAAAKKASANGQFEEARIAAQAGLRLTQDPSARNDLLKILQVAYQALPAYRLTSFQLVSLGRRELATDDSAPAKQEHTHQALAEDLLFLGLYDEAMPEFFAARASTSVAPAGEKQADTTPGALAPQAKNSSVATPDEGYSIAVYSLRGGLPYRTVRFAEQYWKSVPADYLLELGPRGLAELLYPAPYRESLLKYAPARNVDPRFVLSIARQESRYQADAKSVAAARGMMQFIPATANEIATKLQLHDFNQNNLYDPDTAVLFGSQYLADLFQQFPAQPEAVAAAYNGGADNVSRWMGRSRAQEPDRYVPEIGFAQSKDYVYRVMANFWTYQRLYDATLQPQTGPTTNK